MKHRWTVKELQKFSDLEIIRATLADRMSDLTNVYSPFYRKLKELYSKIDDLIRDGYKSADKGRFHITSIDREDIASQFDPVTANSFNDYQMKRIASEMADAYCEMSFHNDLKNIVSEHLTDDEGNSMKLISDGEFVMIYKLQNGNLLLRATNEAKEQYGNNGEKLIEKDIDEAFFDYLLQDHLAYEFEVLKPGRRLKYKHYFVITNETTTDENIKNIGYWWICKKENSIKAIFDNGLVMQYEQHNEGETS